MEGRSKQKSMFESVSYRINVIYFFTIDSYKREKRIKKKYRLEIKAKKRKSQTDKIESEREKENEVASRPKPGPQNSRIIAVIGKSWRRRKTFTVDLSELGFAFAFLLKSVSDFFVHVR